MGEEQTIERGVDSSAIDMAKNYIEYEDDRRNTQHREWKGTVEWLAILLCVWELLTASLNK